MTSSAPSTPTRSSTFGDVFATAQTVRTMYNKSNSDSVIDRVTDVLSNLAPRNNVPANAPVQPRRARSRSNSPVLRPAVLFGDDASVAQDVPTTPDVPTTQIEPNAPVIHGRSRSRLDASITPETWTRVVKSAISARNPLHDVTTPQVLKAIVAFMIALAFAGVTATIFSIPSLMPFFWLEAVMTIVVTAFASSAIGGGFMALIMVPLIYFFPALSSLLVVAVFLITTYFGYNTIEVTRDPRSTINDRVGFVISFAMVPGF